MYKGSAHLLFIDMQRYMILSKNENYLSIINNLILFIVSSKQRCHNEYHHGINLSL
ncbi:isochorismate hydrolase [Microbacter margulisiae]|uniref:Isochorismate hydrolase n=1 Tax=Microbacter margulisiae TaxID=1350067 RepID=A0A7W5H1R8_9PORP|nr:isochorismate hydrolase [Microbacter margulisiae]